jgi:FKBP-type peptidyl-prolyl cis-trans isomerase FklB
MKFGAVAVMIVGVVLLAGASYGAEQATPKSENEKTSYAVGVQLGNTIKRQFPDSDLDNLTKGLRDAFYGKELLLTDKEMAETMAAVQKELLMKQAKLFKETAEKNAKEGQTFFAENKKRQGVVTLPSGLQYRIITEGTGSRPKQTDTVEVNYIGTLINGNEFDNTYRRGKPIVVPVDGVIKGWSEALQLMKVGSKWQLFLPAELAYGKEPHGAIGPSETVLIETELLSIKEQKNSECKEGMCAPAASEPGH